MNEKQISLLLQTFHSDYMILEGPKKYHPDEAAVDYGHNGGRWKAYDICAEAIDTLENLKNKEPSPRDKLRIQIAIDDWMRLAKSHNPYK